MNGQSPAVVGVAVTTIEGRGGQPPVQTAWLDVQVPQCGYRQSGQIMAAAALLAQNPRPTDADIDTSMTHLSRCATDQRIRRGIHAAAATLPEPTPAPTAPSAWVPRALLAQDAADRFGVAPSACCVTAGVVRSGDHQATFGELAAAVLEPPDAVPLKDPRSFTLLGSVAPPARPATQGRRLRPHLAWTSSGPTR